MASSKALVILSGGQDSCTTLFLAKRDHEEVHAITFDYNQRHRIEIESAKKVAEMAKVASHEVITLGPVLKGASPLVDMNGKVGHYESADKLPGGIEPTFVPARNILFLAIAANRAAVLGCEDIYIGVCEADYGGYPDCRFEFIDNMAHAISSGLYDDEDSFMTIQTPLMKKTKAETVKLAKSLPGCWEALAYTTTSYDGDYPPNPFNHASLLRARGFNQANLPDPLIERAIKEGLLPKEYPLDGLVEGTVFNSEVGWKDMMGARIV